ncbi:hypothetical protein ON010_g15170 [Phytophthora cinnamomi]|nr:hypothetical protein ON010_g15170 [Phytophthora cinnamomi]
MFVVDEGAPSKEFKVWYSAGTYLDSYAAEPPRVSSIGLFRGEEEAPYVSIRVPSKELRSKVAWTYGSVPYMFGYAAPGYIVDLIVLHPGDEEGVVVKTRIGAYKIELKEHRFQAVLALLNLALLFPAIVEACPLSGQDGYMDIKCQSGAVVRLLPTFVRKNFPDTTCFDHLKSVYGQMKRVGVPNVDRLTDLHLSKRAAIFEPRGTIVRPYSLLELFGALRQRERNSWFLVDFVDAATSPQPSTSCQHLSEEEHAPEMFVENSVHTSAVDIWAVGFLIETSTVEWHDLTGRTSFYKRLFAEDPAARPSAVEALRDLMELQEAAQRDLKAVGELQQGTKSRKRKHP